MSDVKRTFHDLSFDNKLNIISDYLDSIRETDNTDLLNERMEWLRRHIPAYDKKDGQSYVFISYSHRDFKQVYNDLAFFSYNARKRVRFWYDEGLPAGDDWFITAEKYMNDPCCVGVVFYLSENLLRSPSVLQEIQLAKSLGKPYFTISLENNKFCAEDFLDREKDAKLLSEVESVFPRSDTSVAIGSSADDIFDLPEKIVFYDDKYENALYRIEKIEDTFSVVEELMPDFICEDTEDGLSIVGYQGNDSSIYIPDRIGGKRVVEIKAAFDNATEIFIPYTVKRILPVKTVEKKGSKSMAVFGHASSLSSISVDERNESFYSKDGVLYHKNGTLVRIPRNHPWDDALLEGVNTIGHSAFFEYGEYFPTISLPETVTHIEDYAFAYTKVMSIDMEEGLKSIGAFAFAHCTSYMPLTTPYSLESIGSHAFTYADCEAIFLESKYIKEVPDHVFWGATADTMSIPDGTEIIHENAFGWCRRLRIIELPKGLRVIESGAFTECKSLYSIRLPKSVEYMARSAFSTSLFAKYLDEHAQCPLKYILYDGGSRAMYYFRMRNNLENTDYPDILIPRDQWLKRIAVRIKITARNRIIDLAEKMKAPKQEKEKKNGSILSHISLTTLLTFILSFITFFIAEMRHLAFGIPEDWVYYTLCAVGALILFYSSNHLYWTYTVTRHKSKIKKGESTDFLTAICNIVSTGMIFIILFDIIAILLTSGIFNLNIFKDLINEIANK
ncbi:MAG: leucine-rich repeat protein [Clostridia bacterium]|nr:leucine-rich repeat protein [Clostridia bacterium]